MEENGWTNERKILNEYRELDTVLGYQVLQFLHWLDKCYMVIYWSYIVNWCINAWTSRVYQSEVTEHNICVIEGILWLFSWCPLPSKNNFGSSDPPYWFLRHHWIYVQSLLLCLCSVICARRLALSMFEMLISGWYSVFAYRLKPLKYIFQGCSCNFYTDIHFWGWGPFLPAKTEVIHEYLV